MKKTSIFSWTKYVLIPVVFAIFTGCNHPLENFSPDQYLGRVKILIDLKLDIIDQGSRRMAVNTDEFIVEVFTASDVLVQSYERFADITGDILLAPGNYYIKVKSSSAPEVGFDNPFYSGSSVLFTIDYEELKEINVEVALANCVITVNYSQSIKDKFLDYYTVITSASGELNYIMDESGEGFFPIEPISIESFLTYELPDGLQSVKIISGTIANPLPQHHYQVQINADLSQGLVPLQITVDESRITEIIMIAENDSVSTVGSIPYGDLLITEIMYNPDMVSDTEGEWFEIYNNSAEMIDLYQLVVKKGIDVQFIISDQVVLGPDEYFVLAKHVNATVNADFIYGSSLTLPNAGEHLVMANFGTDGTDGATISEVDYRLVEFPVATGASINLSTSLYDVEAAKNGINWCASSASYETGDLGTPGSVNSSCE